jgi:hypothetical protein
MTLPTLLDSLTVLSRGISLRSSHVGNKALPANVLLILLMVAEHAQRQETITVTSLTKLLGLKNSSVLEGVNRLVESELLVRAPLVRPAKHRALLLTDDAVELLISSIKGATRAAPVFS